MRQITKFSSAAMAIAAATLIALPAMAADQLKIAIGQINNWENQGPTLGQDAGFYKKQNLELENVGTAGAGETLQAVISGGADIGIGVGSAGVIRAFSKGAPVRILLPAFTGSSDTYWYVRADSPFKSLKDLKPENTIAFSTSGSSSNAIVLAFVSELGAKGKPTSTGSPPSTLTQVMSGQIDVGWSSSPFALKELKEGKIRIIARGSDVPSMKDQTVRVIIVNSESLKTKRDAIMRFVAGYRETIDWMYSDPKAIGMFATKVKIDEGIAKDAVKDFFPKQSVQTDKISDLDGIMRDAVKLKFVDAPLTDAQIKEMVQIPPRK